eukprot:876208_1
MHSRPVQAMASDDEPNMIESRRPRGVSTDESTSNNDSWSNYKKWSKELAAKANQKRKAPDNDTLIGNETKRLKLNNDIVSGDDEPNINTRLLRGVLSTDEDSDDMDLTAFIRSQIQPFAPTIRSQIAPMLSVMDNVTKIFNDTEYTQSQMELFVEHLCAVSTAQDIKLKELKFRQHFVNHFKGEEVDKIIETMLMGVRYRIEEPRTECDMGNIERYVDYSMDIALRSSHPHRQYVREMNKFLNPYVDGVKEICSIICDYSQNGYRWYRLYLSQQVENDPDDICSINSGILFNLDFDILDYFMDNTYYEVPRTSRSIRPLRHHLVKFSILKKELNCEELSNLNGDELTEIISRIVDVSFGDGDDLPVLNCYEDWVKEVHNV